MIGLYSIAAIQSSFKVIQWINITIKWKKIFWQKKLLFIINQLKYLKSRITWDRNEIQKIWWYFSTGNFLCCIQKSQFYKSKFKGYGTIADMCVCQAIFALKIKKKSKTGARWALGPCVFAYTSAMQWCKLLQNGGGNRPPTLQLHGFCLLWANCTT